MTFWWDGDDGFDWWPMRRPAGLPFTRLTAAEVLELVERDGYEDEDDAGADTHHDFDVLAQAHEVVRGAFGEDFPA